MLHAQGDHAADVVIVDRTEKTLLETASANEKAGITAASTFFIMLPRILKKRERELGISGDIARGAN